MRRSRRFIEEYKLKPLANVDKERENKRGKRQRKNVRKRKREEKK